MTEVSFIKKIFFRKKDNKSLKEVFGDELDVDNLEKEEKKMIHGIVELSETTVKEIMVPRIDVIRGSESDPISEIINVIVESGHSRIPIFRNSIDNITGILYAKDLLRYFGKKTGIDIKKLVRTPYFVPGTMKIDELLKNFKKKNVHIAVVVDEYGGCQGIVTIEDIIEEIVGEIRDEYDREEPMIKKLNTNSFIIDARMSIDDANEELDFNLPDEDYDTVGGFAYSLFGKIPKQKDCVTHNNMKVEIEKLDGNRIEAIKITRTKNK